MYADNMTRSMKAAIYETERRRKKQKAYNEANGIVPKTIVKGVRDLIDMKSVSDKKSRSKSAEKQKNAKNAASTLKSYHSIPELQQKMLEAAERLDFETAAIIRDQIRTLEKELL